MGCNCGKKRQPTGWGTIPVKLGEGSEQPEAESYQFTAPDGQRFRYGSLLEAQAHQVRAGGGTITPG